MNKEQQAMFMGLIRHRFDDEQIQFIRMALLEARGQGPQDRTNTGMRSIELQSWEEKNGELNAQMMTSWIRKQGLHHDHVVNLVEEFRISMMAKGKRYKNFVLAFQTYLVKGYLSKNLEQCKAQSTSTSVRNSTRGLAL
jgi:hypothetical protein